MHFLINQSPINIKKTPQTELLLWGRLAQLIDGFPVSSRFRRHYAEQPYNLSFIHNPEVLDYFRPLRLLRKK